MTYWSANAMHVHSNRWVKESSSTVRSERIHSFKCLTLSDCQIVFFPLPFYGPGYFCLSSKVTDTHWVIEKGSLQVQQGELTYFLK